MKKIKETTGEATPVKKASGQKLSKKSRRWIIGGSIAVVAVVVIVIVFSNGGQTVSGSGIVLADTMVLTSSDVQNSISATGTVESASKKNVYSTMNYTVAEVLAEVGDYVQAGDVLLELDKASIEEQIKEKEISLENSKKSGGQSVKTASDNYKRYKEGIENGTNSSLISASSSVQTAYDNYVKAQKTYNEYYASLNRGDNSTLLSQESTLSSAENNLRNAQAEYDTARSELAAAQNALNAYQVRQPAQTELQNAQSAVDTAETVLRNAEQRLNIAYMNYTAKLEAYTQDQQNPAPDPNLLTALTAAEEEYRAAETARTAAQNDLNSKKQQLASLQSASQGTDSTLQSLQADVQAKQTALNTKSRTLSTAEDSYDSACKSYTAALRSTDSTLDDYAKNVQTAYTSYQNALDSRTAAEVAADNQLESYQNSLSTARISANTDLGEYQLEQMYVDLENATITAPVSGTVTAVYATEGASSSGILFVIEDTENLIVKSTVKGYDIGSVQTGMAVTIKSDTTGSAEHAGVITSIAPTSSKNSQGETDTSGDIVFPTKVSVTSKDTGLRIGLNVRLQYILEEQKQVLSVPYGAIYTNEQNQDCILVLDEQPDGTFILHETVVETGMENDVDVIISGEELVPGMRVLNNPGNFLTLRGQAVPVSEQSNQNSNMGGFMPF